MTYAIISLGGKQYRVQEGQRLLVDQLAYGDGRTFNPTVLFVGGDGQAEFAPKGTQVTVKVVGSAQGDKIRIGKYKKRTGYRRHTGHRAKLTQIEITAIGAKTAAKPTAEKAKAPAEEKPKTAPKPKTAAKPRAAAQSKPDAQAKPAARAKAEPEPAETEGAE